MGCLAVKHCFSPTFLKSGRGLGWSPIKYKPLVRLARLQKLSGTLPPAFLPEKSGTKELDFVFYEFVRLNLCRTNGYEFAEDKICYFCLLVRENCRRSYRLCAVAFMLCKLKKLHKTKTNKKAAKYRTNGVSGMLGGKILFFPHFF